MSRWTIARDAIGVGCIVTRRARARAFVRRRWRRQRGHLLLLARGLKLPEHFHAPLISLLLPLLALVVRHIALLVPLFLLLGLELSLELFFKHGQSLLSGLALDFGLFRLLPFGLGFSLLSRLGVGLIKQHPEGILAEDKLRLAPRRRVGRPAHVQEVAIE